MNSWLSALSPRATIRNGLSGSGLRRATSTGAIRPAYCGLGLSVAPFVLRLHPYKPLSWFHNPYYANRICGTRKLGNRLCHEHPVVVRRSRMLDTVALCASKVPALVAAVAIASLRANVLTSRGGSLALGKPRRSGAFIQPLTADTLGPAAHERDRFGQGRRWRTPGHVVEDRGCLKRILRLGPYVTSAEPNCRGRATQRSQIVHQRTGGVAFLVRFDGNLAVPPV